MGTTKSKILSSNGTKQSTGVVGEESLVPGYKWIVIHPKYLGGKPAILGRRISIMQILDDMAAGWTIEDYEEEFDVPREAMVEALHYASELLGKQHVAS